MDGIATIRGIGGEPLRLSLRREIRRGFRVGELPAGHRGLRERWVQGAWSEGLYAEERLRLCDGRGLRVISPGCRNEGPGPDFRSACIRIGRGPVVVGDVEVHLRASDWIRHGHHGDREYRGVVLHVVYLNDLPEVGVERSDGTLVPMLELRGRLPEGCRDALSPLPSAWDDAEGWARPGRCHLFMSASPEGGASLLDEAGDERFRGKVERYRALIPSLGPDEALYRGTVEAMGYSRFRSGFAAMAARVPLGELGRLIHEGEPWFNPLLIQSLLMGASGLLTHLERRAGGCDEEARLLLRRMTSIWGSYRGRSAHSVSGSEVPEWEMRGVRPANLPWRRVAAASHFIARHGCAPISDIVLGRLIRWGADAAGRGGRGAVGSFRDAFLPLYPDYWERHYTLGGRATPAPVTLMGEERLITVICNVFLPFLVAWRGGDPAVERAASACYSALPPTGGNRILGRASGLLLGGDRELLGLIDGARREQGVHHIYERYCRGREGSCGGCAHYRRLARSW